MYFQKNGRHGKVIFRAVLEIWRKNKKPGLPLVSKYMLFK
jgi:hypothetical protein